MKKPKPKKAEAKRKTAWPAPKLPAGEEHLARVRQLCFSQVSDDELAAHISEAWRTISQKQRHNKR